MIVNILGWALIIASWTVPQKWFENENKWRATRITCAGIACGLFTGALLNMIGL